MRIYKWSVYITGVLTSIALIVAVLLNYNSTSQNPLFWCNVALGVFGSGLLTLLTSIIGYLSERRTLLEDFQYHTIRILKYLNKYDASWDRTLKIKFFLNYSDEDNCLWDSDMGKISFIRKHKKSYEYIYSKIYKPIVDFNAEVAQYTLNMRWHMSGEGKNDAVMDEIIQKLESHLLKQSIHEPDDQTPTRIVGISNKLVHSIREELSGEYYDLMYPWKCIEQRHGKRQ